MMSKRRADVHMHVLPTTKKTLQHNALSKSQRRASRARGEFEEAAIIIVRLENEIAATRSDRLFDDDSSATKV
jgi:hypothetical protein